MASSKLKIAPSILSADLGHLARAIEMLHEGGADLVHLDIMDGHFVPNLTFGPAFCKHLKSLSKIPFDTHLMLTHPSKYAPNFAEAGSDWITFHVESADDARQTIKLIKGLGVKVGMSINPPTPFSKLEPFIPELDMVVVMTVNPGFGGQKFMPEQLPKIAEARKCIDKIGSGIELEVDGGINEENVGTVAKAGASIVVAGAAVFRGKRGPVEEIRALRKAAEQ